MEDQLEFMLGLEDEIEEDDIEEQDDGSAIVTIKDLDVDLPFDANLAEIISETKLEDLANDLLEKLEVDKKARKRRDEQYEEGLRRTGMGDDAPGGAQFKGASKVVHPVMAESCIDFAARAIKELFPADGPVKMETDGLLPPEQEFEIKKISRCLNDQFTREIPEYRNVYEQVLTQLPLGGSQYTKFIANVEEGIIEAEFVPIDDIFLPYGATSLYSARRFSHRQYIEHAEYESRVDSGYYRDLRSVKMAQDPEYSAAALANDKIEGKESSGTNEDGARTVYEFYLDRFRLKDDDITKGTPSPYIVCIDEYEQKILSIRRNWSPDDQRRTRIDWIVEDTFIVWRGAQGIGLPHLIGGLAAAATGSLRALLDSAHINNFPTALKLKGSKINGKSESIAVTQIADIEGPVGIDDVRKFIMPMPFNAPSNVLYQLLGWLTEAAKGVVSTASEKIADATSNTPVGTTQALIEQGAIIFSSIHSRLHHSQAKKFEVVLRILKTYFPDKLQKYGINPQQVDLNGVRPVSDPRIFSEAQRFSRAQGLMQLAKESPPGTFNDYEIRRMMLSLMKVDNIDRILPPPPPQAQPTDPANELLAMMMNKPVATGPQQNHIAHIQTHINFLKDPLCGRNPIMIMITQKVLDHLREHIIHFVTSRMQAAVQQMMPPQPQQPPQIMPGQPPMGPQGAPGGPEQMGQGQNMPQVPPQAVDGVMAQASFEIMQQDMQIASEAQMVIEETIEFIRNTQQDGMFDPTMASTQMLTEAQVIESERKAKADRMKYDNDKLKTLATIKINEDKARAQAYKDTAQGDADGARIDQQREEAFLDAKVELWKNREDNATTLQVEAAKLAQAELSKDVPEQPEPKGFE